MVNGLEAVTVNISGGVAAGDHISGMLECEEGADVLVTSQATERIYRARPDDTHARIETSCKIGSCARLEWLPHGTIFFDGCCLRRRMTVEMQDSSSFLFLECRMFGRTGSGERLERLDVHDRLSIRRAGRLVLEDMSRIECKGLAGAFAGKALTAGQTALATLVMVAPDAEARIHAVRERLSEIGAREFACSAWNGMLVLRGMSESGRVLEEQVQHLLPVIRDGRPMPATWRS
jgi:urease accessory protein